jgi:hypothetical protein
MDEVVRRAGGLHAREWDGEYVVYSERNDRTHLISGFAAVAFARLDSAPCGKSALIGAVVSAGATAEDAEKSLDYLREIELVEIGASR